MIKKKLCTHNSKRDETTTPVHQEGSNPNLLYRPFQDWMLTFSAKAKYQTVSRSAYSNQSSVEKTIINAIVTLWIEEPTILKLNTIFLLIVTEISMYLRYFYCCIGNRYSVFYENYIISQLTVRKKKFRTFFVAFHQITNLIPQDSQKLRKFDER